MKRVNVSEHEGWSQVTVNLETLDIVGGAMEEELDPSADQQFIVASQLTANALEPGEAIYLKAPPLFTGTRHTSYGGKITVKVVSMVDGEQKPLESQPDIILVGTEDTFIHVVDLDNNPPSNEFVYEVYLNESSFRTNMQGISAVTTVDRGQFMQLLFNVQALLVRVAYFSQVDNVAVSFTMEDAEIADNLEDLPEEERVYTVEACSCPDGYSGLSCENCASGYYRQGPRCSQCECNGHSNECDPVSGRCLQCDHNTEGDHCERCLPGFYGNASGGTPNDCYRCPCPRATETNNFALSCEVSTTEMIVNCICPEGYLGHRCEECAVGYWGNPTEPGSSCKKCDCNSNNDLDIEGNCDKKTGMCLNCENHTAGPSCADCEMWYFGDAIEAKDCTDCKCNRRGASTYVLDSG